MALLEVEEEGAGEPLVLVHGLATTHQIWVHVAPRLARTRRVIAVDLPGFGGSVPVGPGFELGAVADRVARGLAAHGVHAPYDLVGHSLGAGIAMTLAAQRPQSVRRLVLVAPAGLAPLPTYASRVLAAGAEPLLGIRRRLAPLTDTTWGRRLLLGFAAADGARLAPLEARLMVLASAGAQRTAEALAAITAADLRATLRDVPAALGVIWGAADRTVPIRHAETIRRERPDAEVVVIERAGHVPMIERPNAFTAALAGLLERLPKHATTPRVGPSSLH